MHKIIKLTATLANGETVEYEGEGFIMEPRSKSYNTQDYQKEVTAYIALPPVKGIKA